MKKDKKPVSESFKHVIEYYKKLSEGMRNKALDSLLLNNLITVTQFKQIQKECEKKESSIIEHCDPVKGDWVDGNGY